MVLVEPAPAGDPALATAINGLGVVMITGSTWREARPALARMPTIWTGSGPRAGPCLVRPATADSPATPTPMAAGLALLLLPLLPCSGRSTEPGLDRARPAVVPAGCWPDRLAIFFANYLVTARTPSLVGQVRNCNPEPATSAMPIVLGRPARADLRYDLGPRCCSSDCSSRCSRRHRADQLDRDRAAAVRQRLIAWTPSTRAARVAIWLHPFGPDNGQPYQRSRAVRMASRGCSAPASAKAESDIVPFAERLHRRRVRRVG
jgi:hypothetical protein